jgi:hypothetical protein
MRRFNYLKCFPDFDSTLPVLHGFTDDSWQNDVCPSLYNETLNLKIFCDYLDPNKRECGGKMFALYSHDDDMALDALLVETDNFLNVQLAVYIEAIKHEITTDTVLSDCKTFSELHNFCDANALGEEYLPDFEDSESMIDFANKGMDAVDAWIRAKL